MKRNYLLVFLITYLTLSCYSQEAPNAFDTFVNIIEAKRSQKDFSSVNATINLFIESFNKSDEDMALSCFTFVDTYKYISMKNEIELFGSALFYFNDFALDDDSTRKFNFAYSSFDDGWNLMYSTLFGLYAVDLKKPIKPESGNVDSLIAKYYSVKKNEIKAKIIKIKDMDIGIQKKRSDASKCYFVEVQISGNALEKTLYFTMLQISDRLFIESIIE